MANASHGWQDKYFGGDQDVTREMVLDDSWEDKTGLVKVLDLACKS